MNRLEELRIKCNLTMRETARLLNIPYTTYVNYEKGTREPNSEMLITLAEFFNVSIDYLLGRNDMPFTEIKNKKINTNTSENITNIEMNMLYNYRKLNSLGKVKAYEYIADLSEQKKYTTVTDNNKYKSAEIDYEIAAWGADGTKGTYKSPPKEVT